MKKLFLSIAFCGLAFGAVAQETAQEGSKKAYDFTIVKEVPATTVKDQASSGTCWSFAGIGFIESELLKNKKGDHDLSEMWIVRHTYYDKAVKYVRMHGTIEFAGGGADHDVFDVIREYGIVPEEAYTGLQYGTDKHRHSEMDAVLKAYVDAIVKNPNKKLTTAWKDGIDGILDAYLGPRPEKFTYQGKEYNAKSFAQHLGLNMNDYVAFTSYTHHPFYTEFAIEVPDNWAWGLSWNIPIDEFMQLLDNSIETGHTVVWGSDVSEPGFIYSKGFAVIPDDNVEEVHGTEISRWVKMSASQRQRILMDSTEPIKEAKITQEMRQVAFDNFETTDDHGMLITGIAVDQNGNKFYKVKNSWDTIGEYDGYFYASEPFVAYKTMNITVHKDAVPKELKKKLGIK